MSAPLTEAEFSLHLNSKFRLKAETPQPVELELIAVKTYKHKDELGETSGMERFSASFQGPPEILLPQQIYPLAHEKMGDIELFLVPIAKNERGFVYEAVFNYWTE